MSSENNFLPLTSRELRDSPPRLAFYHQELLAAISPVAEYAAYEECHGKIRRQLEEADPLAHAKDFHQTYPWTSYMLSHAVIAGHNARIRYNILLLKEYYGVVRDNLSRLSGGERERFSAISAEYNECLTCFARFTAPEHESQLQKSCAYRAAQEKLEGAAREIFDSFAAWREAPDYSPEALRRLSSQLEESKIVLQLLEKRRRRPQLANCLALFEELLPRIRQEAPEMAGWRKLGNRIRFFLESFRYVPLNFENDLKYQNVLEKGIDGAADRGELPEITDRVLFDDWLFICSQETLLKKLQTMAAALPASEQLRKLDRAVRQLASPEPAVIQHLDGGCTEEDRRKILHAIRAERFLWSLTARFTYQSNYRKMGRVPAMKLLGRTDRYGETITDLAYALDEITATVYCKLLGSRHTVDGVAFETLDTIREFVDGRHTDDDITRIICRLIRQVCEHRLGRKKFVPEMVSTCSELPGTEEGRSQVLEEIIPASGTDIADRLTLEALYEKIAELRPALHTYLRLLQEGADEMCIRRLEELGEKELAARLRIGDRLRKSTILKIIGAKSTNFLTREWNKLEKQLAAVSGEELLPCCRKLIAYIDKSYFKKGR